jgi:hypothetical protein
MADIPPASYDPKRGTRAGILGRTPIEFYSSHLPAGILGPGGRSALSPLSQLGVAGFDRDYAGVLGNVPRRYKTADLYRAVRDKIGNTDPEIWRIGLTHDPVTRRREWGCRYDVAVWEDWPAATLADAESVERAFLALGMRGGTGGNLSEYQPVWAYVF